MATILEAINRLKNNTAVMLSEPLKFPVLKFTQNVSARLEAKYERIASGPLSSEELKALLQKLVSGSSKLGDRDIKNIPFVLYLPDCDEKIFESAFSKLNLKKQSHLERLAYSYLGQYDETWKTSYLSAQLQKIIESHHAEYSRKVLKLLDNHTEMFLSVNRIELFAAYCIQNESLISSLEKLECPRVLYASMFVKKALLFLFGANNSLQVKINLLEEIGNDNSGLFDLYLLADIADRIIPAVEMSNSDSKNEYKKTCLSIFYKCLGDPRYGNSQHIWMQQVADEARSIFIRWITENDMQIFFDVIRDTAIDRMWKYREAFWRAYLPYISNSWVLFGSEAEQKVKSHGYRKAGFGKIRYNGDRKISAFAFQIGEYVFLEISHNGKLRAWPKQNAPDFFGVSSLVYSDWMNNGALLELPHTSPETYNWQTKAAIWLNGYCGIDKGLSDWRLK